MTVAAGCSAGGTAAIRYRVEGPVASRWSVACPRRCLTGEDRGHPRRDVGSRPV